MRNNNFNNRQNNNINYSYAPYNFIPLSKRVIKRYNSINELPGHDEFTVGTLSGEIEYIIENITDLIISDGNGRFFRNLDGKFTIPGSTMRGKLRSNIGVLGFGGVSEDIQDERYLYRRFASSSSNLNKEYNDRLGMKIERINGNTFSTLKNVQAGYIKKISDEEYVIIKSKEIKGKSYFRVAEVDLITKANGITGVNYMKDSDYEPYVKEISYEVNENNKGIKAVAAKNKYKNNGYLIGSGKIPGKKSHYVINEVDLSKDNEDKHIKLSPDDIRIYKKYYIKDKKSKLNRSGFYSLPENKNEMKPVFYIQYNGKVYFGFTQYLRMFYDKSIHDGLPKEHKSEVIDYKKSIFGFTNGKSGYKGRVSIEDAIAYENVKTTKHTMVLGEPKATCVQLYLKQDGDRNSLYSYNGEFELRGIKYYWIKEYVTPKIGSSNVNTVEEAVEKGAKFKGKISFTNLSEDELGLLVWSLYIDKDAHQNIGKGKPYGFGNIVIRDIKVKVKDVTAKYNDIFANEYYEMEVEKAIDKYKEYIKNKYPALNNVEEDIAVKTFVEVHKNKNRVEPVSYMSINRENVPSKEKNQFAFYHPLSTPFEVLGIKKKVVSVNNSNNNYQNRNNNNYSKNNNGYKNNNNKNNSNNNYSKKKSVYDDGDIGDNPFAALLNYKYK